VNRFLSAVTGACLAFYGCATDGSERPAERKFYKNTHVRRCLQLDKERRVSQARACWAELLARIESDPAYREKSGLGEADVARIHERTGLTAGHSHDLRRKLERCFNIPTGQRERRLACLEGYLARHRKQLSVGERYEVESAISATKQARERAAGNVESTIEHAGRLRGARLHLEDEGVRIDEVRDGPMAQAGCPEQGIIVALDGTPVGEFDAPEIIARLEACQEWPLVLLVRQGGIDEVTFTRAECSCGQEPKGKLLGQARLPAEVCTTSGSRELRLGISWCYLARDGVLEVEEVCRESPADAAGVRPDHRYVGINGRAVLGLTYRQIEDLLESHPDEPIRFESRSGVLQSPTPLTGKPLQPDRAERFWQAIRRSLEIEEKSEKP